MKASGQLHNPANLPSGKVPPVHTGCEVGHHSQYGQAGEEKYPCTCWELNPGYPAVASQYTD